MSLREILKSEFELNHADRDVQRMEKNREQKNWDDLLLANLYRWHEKVRTNGRSKTDDKLYWDALTHNTIDHHAWLEEFDFRDEVLRAEESRLQNDLHDLDPREYHSQHSLSEYDCEFCEIFRAKEREK